MSSEPPIPPEPPIVPPAPYAPPPGPPPGSAPAPLPWEAPGPPSIDAAFSTIGLVLTRPREAFQRMAVTGSYARPMTLALVLGVIGVIIASMYQFALGDFWSSWMGHWWRSDAHQVSRIARLLIGVVGSPFFVIVGLLVGTGIYHLFLMLFGVSAGGIGATFRVVCYSEAACALFAVVPFLGEAVGIVWRIVICIVGFAVVHRATTGRTAFAVLAPIVLCLAFCCVPLVIWRAVMRPW